MENRDKGILVYGGQLTKRPSYYSWADLEREEHLRQAEPEMLQLDGMDNDLVNVLVAHEIKTRDDLGELAVDELVEMAGIDEERASKLILGARAHWFNN